MRRSRALRQAPPPGGKTGLPGAVTHLHCPRCGLTITPKADWLVVDYCPRCLARRHVVMRMFGSTLTADELYAPNSRAGRDRTDRAERRITSAPVENLPDVVDLHRHRLGKLRAVPPDSPAA